MCFSEFLDAAGLASLNEMMKQASPSQPLDDFLHTKLLEQLRAFQLIGGMPVEVKAGNRGQMQSLHLFMAEHESPFGVRLSHENFGQFENIHIVPLYAAGQMIIRIPPK